MILGIPVSQVVQGLLIPLFAGITAGGLVTLWILTVVGAVSLVVRILDWQRRYFSFDGEVLRVDSGVIGRSHRSLDVDRIQQVEIQRGPVQRLLHLAAIRVETAGNASEPEVDLRVLPEADALALRAAVRASKARSTGRTVQAGSVDDSPEGSPARTVLEVPNGHVALAAVTGARLLVLPAVLGAGLQLVSQQAERTSSWIADRLEGVARSVTNGPVEGPDWWLIALSAVAVVVLAMLVAVVVGLVRDGRYRIERIDDDLHVTRGLLTTRESVVPLSRVQLVVVQRNWLRRLLGYAAVQIRSAGGSTGGDGRVTVPLLPISGIDRLLGEVLPGVPGIPPLTAHPSQALRRTLFRWLRPPGFIIAVLWLSPELFEVMDNVVVTRAAWISLALVPLSALLAVVEYRHLAHALSNVVVVSRRGALSVATTLAPVVKVQAVSTRANIFQRRLGLASLIAHVAGPGALLEIMDAAASDAEDLHAQLTAHAASPTLTAVAPASGGCEPESA